MGKFTGTLIASDLDGTLFNSEGKISARTCEALEYYKQNGGIFTVSTGRVHQSFTGFRHGIPFNAPVLLGNGTMIYDYEKEKIVYECNLPEHALQAVRETQVNFPDVGIEIYKFGETYICRMAKYTKKHVENLKFGYIETENAERAAQPWQKVLFTGEPDMLQKLKTHLSDRYPDFQFVFSIPIFLEMFNRKTNKGAAALRLADLLGVPREGLYTVGDNQNDVDMLQAAAISFAPENGHPDALSAADVILPSNDEHTVAALVDYLDGQGHA